MKSIKIYFNPASRGGKSKKIALEVQKYFDDQGVKYSFEETKHPKSAIEQCEVAKNEGYELVIALGGDGTVHEVANGAIKYGLEFGVIPVGSGNDFAAGLGLSAKSWKNAVDTIINGKTVSFPAVKVGEYYSINVLDAGLGADVAKSSETRLKWISGSLKYSILTILNLFKHKRYPVKLDIDGKPYQYSMNILAAGFGQTFGAGMNILPDVRFDHEEMEIVVIHSASRFAALRLFPSIFNATHVNKKKYVDVLRGKKVKITCEREMRVEAEGEEVGYAPIELEVMPNILQIRVPKDWNYSDKNYYVK